MAELMEQRHRLQMAAHPAQLGASYDRDMDTMQQCNSTREHESSHDEKKLHHLLGVSCVVLLTFCQGAKQLLAEHEGSNEQKDAPCLLRVPTI